MFPYGTTLNFICLLTKTRLFNMIDFFVVKKCFSRKILLILFSLCFKDAYGNGWYLNLDGVDCLKNKAKRLTIIS